MRFDSIRMLSYSKMSFFRLIKYLVIKAISGLIYSLGIYLFYGEESIRNSLILILGQEILFSYYLNDIRTRKVRSLSSYSFMSILLSSILVALVIIILDPVVDNLLLLIAILIFPFAQYKLAYIESESFEVAIKYENVYAPLSSLLFFVSSAFLFWMKLDVSVFLFSRFFFLFITIVFIVPGKIKVSFSPKNLSYSDIPIAVISVFIFKSVLYSKFRESADGEATSKLFIVLYDILAMTYGYTVRRFLTQNSENNFGASNKVKVFYGFVVLTLLALSLFLLNSNWSILLLGSFAIAGVFNFMIVNRVYKLIFVSVNLIAALLLFNSGNSLVVGSYSVVVVLLFSVLSLENT